VKPPARAIVGNLVWSTDGGVWAVWEASPFPHAHMATADKLAVHGRIRGLLLGLPPDSMLLSVSELIDPMDVVDRMVDGVPVDRNPAWGVVCEATADWLDQVPLHNRRYYVAAALPSIRRAWQDLLRDAVSDVTSAFGIDPAPISPEELDLRQRQAHELEVRLGQHVRLARVTAGEICWLYARALRREADEPCYDELWEPPAAREDDRPRGVLAQLTDAVVKEGGDAEDEDRPRHRRYVKVETGVGVSYQTVLAMADMPHYFHFPGGGGEWLFHADRVGFPVDWCVRIRSVRNLDAQARVRRKHRDLIGQVDEYDGDLSGAPPALAEAIDAMETQRAQLGSNPAEPELQITVLFSVAAASLVELEHRAAALQARFEPQEYGLARPTGGQAALLRTMLPGTAASHVCRDYTQFLLTSDLAAGSPFCGPDVGDPTGLLLGVSLDGGNNSPVLFDPAFGPKANASPSLAAVGRLGSGKSFFLKRLCWDTIARGGQVVTIDRTPAGEYARFAESLPGRTQIVRLEAGADIHLDPMRSFSGDERTTVTLGFLSLLAGSSAHSDEGAALAEAVDAMVAQPDACLADVVDQLERMGASTAKPDPAARSLARRLAHYRRSATGQLAFGKGRPMTLDADFIVFWAPNLALADRETLSSDAGMRMMLPEQVLGQALLYLVAAVGRRVVFSDPRRFAAALYDEAWALLASPHGQKLLIEGVRDGRKHNGAIWLASQHPNDFAIAELEDLLGSRFVFRQARQAIPTALRFLGTPDSADAAATLEGGLDTGTCLYRDVRDRVGLIQVLPPALAEVEEAMNTSPSSARPDAAEDYLDNDADDDLLRRQGIEDLGTILHQPGRVPISVAPTLEAPAPLLAPDPDPEPVVAPALPRDPAPAPVVAAAPAPEPEPAPGPEPQPVVAPISADRRNRREEPEAVPGPEPVATRRPAPEPVVAAAPVPVPEPESVVAPISADRRDRREEPEAEQPPAAAAEAEPAGSTAGDPAAAAAKARAEARRRRRSPLAQALAEEVSP